MPIYEYQCESCGAHLEKLQKVSDPVLKECPECHQPSLKKMISASSFRLKGTGWYETDFKTGKKKHGAEGKPGGSENSKEKADNAGSNKDKASVEKSGSSGSSAKTESGKATESAKSSTSSKGNGSTADSK